MEREESDYQKSVQQFEGGLDLVRQAEETQLGADRRWADEWSSGCPTPQPRRLTNSRWALIGLTVMTLMTPKTARRHGACRRRQRR